MKLIEKILSTIKDVENDLNEMDKISNQENKIINRIWRWLNENKIQEN